MNLHMTRRLEVLAKEIAASRAPKIDAEANARFLVNTSVLLPSGVSTFITEADCRQIKGAATEQGCKADAPGTADTNAAPPSPQAEQPASFKAVDADGWIEHKRGDPMPVDGETMVEVRFRNRMEHWVTISSAGSWVGCWSSAALSAANIVAYRVLP